jgi:HK97 gp10 family phage protein
MGMPELDRKFRELEQLAQEKVLEDALVSGALVVANEWKRRAPYKTGNYRRSIHIGGHTDQTPDFEGSDLGRQRSGEGKARVIVGTNITDPPYPAYLEYGTRRMAARPSAIPAFLSKRADAVKEFGEALKEILRRLV